MIYLLSSAVGYHMQMPRAAASRTNPSAVRMAAPATATSERHPRDSASSTA